MKGPSMRLAYYLLTCSVLFIGGVEPSQNVSKEITFVSDGVSRLWHSCINRCHTPSLFTMECGCDDKCIFYRDCCFDYLHYCSDDADETLNVASSSNQSLHIPADAPKPRWSCVTDPENNQTSSEGILVVVTCPPSWTIADVRRKCEVDGRRVVSEELVYDSTGYVYANQFCAICNTDIGGNRTLEGNSTFCDSAPPNATNCSTEFFVEGIDSNDAIQLRPCSLPLCRDCNTFIISDSMYNPITADIAPRTVLSAVATKEIFIGPNDYEPKYISVETYTCNDDEYYDAITEECQRCENGTIIAESEYLSALNDNTFRLNLLGGVGSADELDTLVYSGSGISENHTMYNGPTVDDDDNVRIFIDEVNSVCITSCNVIEDDLVDEGSRGEDEGWITLTANDSKLSCRVLKNALVNVTTEIDDFFSYNKVMSLVNIVVCVISLVALFVSILTLICFPSLLNLPGICRLCLMISLFLAQLIMLTIAYVPEPEQLCIGTAVVMHFFWLAMFCWTNVLAFDLARVFGTKSSRPNTTKKRRLLSFYMLYGWGLPLAIVTACVALHSTDKFDFSYGGNSFCWFSNRHSLVLAFTIPVSICIVLNFILYIVTVIGIWKVRRVTEFAVRENDRAKKRKDELKLYIKLSILMGVTWSLVFITVYTDKEILWYIFIILNGLQGFFIFIAFTCNRQTLAKLKGAYATHVESQSSSRQLTKSTSV